MENESYGEVAGLSLEEVVEAIAVPGQLLFASRSEPLVGAADDSFSSCLLDDDPFDGRGGDDGFDSGGFGELYQQPWYLAGIQGLRAAARIDGAQPYDNGRWDGADHGVEVCEAPHRSVFH